MVINLVTNLAWSLNFISLAIVLDFLKIVSSLDRLLFSSFISGVMKGL